MPRIPDLASYLAARIVPALAAMALTFLCIHTLAPDDYAVYSMSMLAVGVAGGFVGGMSSQAMLRYAQDLSPRALRRGLVVVPLAAAALAAPLVLGYLGWRIGLSATAWLAAASLPAYALVDTRRSLFVAFGRSAPVFALDASRAATALALGAALFWAWGALPQAPMLAQLVSLGVCLALVRSRADERPPAGRREIDATYLGHGMGIATMLAVIVALSLAERSVLASVASLADSGRYAAQADVINAVYAAVGGALASSMMPAYLAQTRSHDRAALRRLLLRGMAGVGVTAIGCALAGAALAPWHASRTAQALTGDVPTGAMLLAAAAVWTAAGFVQKPLELNRRIRWIVVGVVGALGLFLLIAPPLAQRAGPTGVALAKLLAGLAYAAFVGMLGRRVP